MRAGPPAPARCPAGGTRNPRGPSAAPSPLLQGLRHALPATLCTRPHAPPPPALSSWALPCWGRGLPPSRPAGLLLHGPSGTGPRMWPRPCSRARSPGSVPGPAPPHPDAWPSPRRWAQTAHPPVTQALSFLPRLPSALLSSYAPVPLLEGRAGPSTASLPASLGPGPELGIQGPPLWVPPTPGQVHDPSEGGLAPPPLYCEPQNPQRRHCYQPLHRQGSADLSQPFLPTRPHFSLPAHLPQSPVQAWGGRKASEPWRAGGGWGGERHGL